MKKALSVCISLLLAALILAPAASLTAQAAERVPVINIVGEREVEVWNEDGTHYTPTNERADAITDEAIRELTPVFVKAFLTNDYGEWSRLALEKLTPIYDEIRPAPDGTLPAHTGPAVEADMPYTAETLPAPGAVNYYYGYCWDFRRSPLEEVESLHTFVEAVKAKSGADKVILMSRCGGTSLVASYLYKYGTQDVAKIIFASSTLLGTPYADAILSGNVQVPAAAFYQYAAGGDLLGGLDESLSKVLTAMLSALTFNGGAEDTITLVLRVYNKIKDSFIAPFLRSYYAICGNYIASVDEFYEDYIDYIYPTEELKAEYAPIIARANEYHYEVQEKIASLLTEARDAGVPVYFIAFYGEANTRPISYRSSLVGDEMCDAGLQSFGATVAEYPGTLTDDYVAEREASGFGAYISPDKQIDASTCLFPETTWFIKNMKHNFFLNDLHDFVRRIAWSDGMTVTSDPAYPQYLTVVGNHRGLAPAEAVNENDTPPVADQSKGNAAVSFFARIIAFFAKIAAWFSNLFARIGK